MPGQSGTASDDCSAIVRGSRKSSRRLLSATTIADEPSGVKYRLYGSSTAIGLPGVPVDASIGTTLLPRLSSTHRVRRSYDGTMCCGSRAVLNDRSTVRVAWSITVTVFDTPFGT